MGRDYGSWGGAVHEPSIVPVAVNGGGVVDRDEHWRSSDNTVNAVSFGFVATAILISMFLIMAIFERFLRPRSSSSGGRSHSDLVVHGKLDFPSAKMKIRPAGQEDEGYGFKDEMMTVYSKGVSVLMPGEEMPTYIAHPARQPSQNVIRSSSPTSRPVYDVSLLSDTTRHDTVCLREVMQNEAVD